MVKFLERIFLVANISPKIVFGILFLTLSSANVEFQEREFKWRNYTINETFSTSKNVKLVGKKKFIAIAFNPKHKIFITYIALFTDFDLGVLPSILEDNNKSFYSLVLKVKNVIVTILSLFKSYRRLLYRLHHRTTLVHRYQ